MINFDDLPKKLKYLLIILGLTLSACGPGQAPVPPKPTTFFDNPACRPPCWENVIPSVTTTDVAMSIFAKLADGKGVSDNPSPYKAYTSQITFSPSPGDYVVFAQTLNGKIMTMEFYQEHDYGLNLEHAIELFGEPQSIVISIGMEGAYDDAILYNPRQGVELEAAYIPRAAGRPVAIGPNTWFFAIEFFDPNHYNNYLDTRFENFANQEKKLMQPWTGYGNYEENYSPP